MSIKAWMKDPDGRDGSIRGLKERRRAISTLFRDRWPSWISQSQVALGQRVMDSLKDGDAESLSLFSVSWMEKILDSRNRVISECTYLGRVLVSPVPK